MPVIVVIDDDDAARAVVARELAGRYAVDYSIVPASSGEEGMGVLRHLAARGEEVALILADRRMGGATILRDARDVHPQARRGLLLEWGEIRTHREEIAEAFALRQADCFVT